MPHPDEQQRPARRPERRWWLALAALTALAAGLRLYGLDRLPAGLNVDEAAEGLMALEILEGARPVFFSSYTGQEAGYMYLVAPLIAVLGQTSLAVRLPAALAGVALVPVTALLGRRAAGPWAGLLAAGAVVGAPWLLHLNRIGFRANLLPLALALWGWLLLRALDAETRRAVEGKPEIGERRVENGDTVGSHSSSSIRDPVSPSPLASDLPLGAWLAAGAVLGLTSYTYLASRFVPVLVALYLGYMAIWHRPLLRRAAPGVALMLGVAAGLTVPLGIHFLRMPSDWNARLGQVWACGAAAGALDCLARIGANGVATLGMVGVRGDPKAFYNLDAGPALPWFAGWLFYLGAAIAARRWRDPRCALLLLWWAVMVLPGVLSSENPSFIRTVGAAPATAVLWALPLASAWGWLGELTRRRRTADDGRRAMRQQPLAATPFPVVYRLSAIGLPALLVITMAASSAAGYFGRWAVDPERYYDFNGYAVDTARSAAATPVGTDLYLSEEFHRHATYLYLEPRTSDARWFDGRAGWPLAAPGRPAIYYAPYTTPLDPAFVEPYLRGAEGENASNELGQYTYSRYRLPDGPPELPVPAVTVGSTLGPMELEGATVQGAGAALRVTLRCRAREQSERELRLFVHLVDAEGRVVAQHDALGYPSREWRPGDRFASFHNLAPPAGTAGASYRVLVGLYDVATGERLPAIGPGARGDSVELPLTTSQAPGG